MNDYFNDNLQNRTPERSVFVPQIREQGTYGYESWDVFSRLLKDRIVFLDGAIDDISADVVIAQLLYVESQDPDKDINLYINSPGGSVTAGLAIYDVPGYARW